jgi:hypothetical protein
MTSTEPAVETWRTTFAAMDAASADPGVLAVAESARFLLLHGHLMPPGERAAMRESLAEAAPADLLGLLSAWHTTAALCAQSAPEPQSGPQGCAADPGAFPADDTNGAPPPAQDGVRGIPGPPVAPRDAQSAAEPPAASRTGNPSPNEPTGATGPAVDRQEASRA